MLDYDYNPGNIFYYREDGAWNFALIDVNRMAFRRNLSRRDCVEMLHHLDWETPYLDYVLIRYAELRRWDWKLLSGACRYASGAFSNGSSGGSSGRRCDYPSEKLYFRTAMGCYGTGQRSAPAVSLTMSLHSGCRLM